MKPLSFIYYLTPSDIKPLAEKIHVRTEQFRKQP